MWVSVSLSAARVFFLSQPAKIIKMAETVPEADVDSIIERLLEGYEILL